MLINFIRIAMINKLLSKIIFLSFILGFNLDASLENSITPHIENFESIDALPFQKYSKNQLTEIESALKRKNDRIRVVSFNMLANDAEEQREEINRWPSRLPRIVEILNDMQPDVIGSQELYQNQLNDLLPYIQDTFSFYGKPRSDGELNGIFYSKNRFEMIKGSVWQIPTMGKLSNTVTMVQLKDIRTGNIFAIFNAHLAFGADEREQEVRFIIEKITPIAKTMPVMLTGDLNTFPNRLDLDRLPFYDGDYTHRLLTNDVFQDSSDVSLLGHLGPISTFTNAPGDGIPFRGYGTPGVMLDRIYVSKGITVLIHAVQGGTINGYFPSDHMPVLIDCLIDNNETKEIL